MNRRAILSLFAVGRFMLLFSPGCKLRRIGKRAGDAVPTPDSRQIIRIKRVTFNFVLNAILLSILVILTSWARLPACRKGYGLRLGKCGSRQSQCGYENRDRNHGSIF